jgi:hypothetical protein
VKLKLGLELAFELGFDIAAISSPFEGLLSSQISVIAHHSRAGSSQTRNP